MEARRASGPKGLDPTPFRAAFLHKKGVPYAPVSCTPQTDVVSTNYRCRVARRPDSEHTPVQRSEWSSKKRPKFIGQLAGSTEWSCYGLRQDEGVYGSEPRGVIGATQARSQRAFQVGF